MLPTEWYLLDCCPIFMCVQKTGLSYFFKARPQAWYPPFELLCRVGGKIIFKSFHFVYVTRSCCCCLQVTGIIRERRISEVVWRHRLSTGLECWSNPKRPIYRRFIPGALVEFVWWGRIITHVRPPSTRAREKIPRVYSRVSVHDAAHWFAATWLQAHSWEPSHQKII